MVMSQIRGIHKPLIGTWSPEFHAPELAALNVSAPANNTWGTANAARGVAFNVWQPITVVKLWMHVGDNNQTNTVDMGIYTFEDTPRRLVSAGSTTMAADNTLQEFDITDTTLAPGRYYLVGSCSAASTSLAGIFHTTLAGGDNDRLKRLAYFITASSHPLPSTLTPAASTGSLMPLMGMSLRTLVA
jgi:hypothetical protein